MLTDMERRAALALQRYVSHSGNVDVLAMSRRIAELEHIMEMAVKMTHPTTPTRGSDE